jgi:hypothetical protein
MTGTEFISHVEVKLNRIATSSYEDIRPEEVIFFANDALKALTLEFDLGLYSRLLDEFATKTYLAHLYGVTENVTVTNNKFTLPVDVFKFKDLEAYVTIGAEADWVGTRFLDNTENSTREDNLFTKSYADTPIYRLIDKEVKFEVSDFKVTKARYDYLKYPVVITEASVLDYPFLTELEDKTVTLILENLESGRINSQPVVSKS